MNTLYSTKDIVSQGKGSLLDGEGVSSIYAPADSIALNYGITGNQSDKLSFGHSANILAQHSAKLFAQSSAKVSAGQSAKFYAGLKYETLNCPDIPNRGEITPFKGFIGVTTRGGVEASESIKKDCVEFCESIKSDRGVEFCESIKKGSISATRFVQPFGSMPSRSNSFRPSVLSQLAKLIFDCFAAASNCSFNSGVTRILNCGDCPSPFGLLSLFTVDKWSPIRLISILIGGHLNMVKPIKSTPPNNATNTIRGLTTSDTETIEVAMSQYITPVTGRNSLTPSQSFRWLFLALERGNSAARPHRIEATAPNEHSARMLLVRDYILSFAGRLPVREVAA